MGLLLTSSIIQNEIQPIYAPAVNLSLLPTASGIATPTSYVAKVPTLWRGYFYRWEKYDQDNAKKISTGSITNATDNLSYSLSQGFVKWNSSDEYLTWRVHGFDALDGMDKYVLRSIAGGLDQVLYSRRLALADSVKRNVAVSEGMDPLGRTDANLAIAQKALGVQLENAITGYNQGPLQKFSLDYQAWYNSPAWQTEMQAYYRDKYAALDAQWRGQFASFFDPVIQGWKTELQLALAAGIIITAGALAPVIGASAGTVQTVLSGGAIAAQTGDTSKLIQGLAATGSELGNSIGGDIGGGLGSTLATGVSLPSVGSAPAPAAPVSTIPIIRPAVGISSTTAAKASVALPTVPAAASKAAPIAAVGGLVLLLILLK